MERRRTRARSERRMSSAESGGVVENNRSNLKGDWKNLILLFFLYTLQGIPLGLSAAIPMILQNRQVSYKQQAEFSLVTWPFSLKLLWAPLVDAIFSSRIGRRKTWLIPTQYLIGGFMLLLSQHMDEWLGPENNPSPHIGMLTLMFFCLNFLAATQDIAVDGWALTMLKKCNVAHASTCNSIGQTTGYFLSYVVFMALESASFCNVYLRTVPQDEGIITLSGFLYFWGWIFLITTTLVAIFKKETEPTDEGEAIFVERDIYRAYKSLREIIKLRSVQTLIIILLTSKIGFSSTDSVMPLKLVEAGVPKERLGLVAIPMIPVQILLPLVLAKYTTGPRPLDIFLKSMPYRLLFGLVGALLVWVTPHFVRSPDEGLPALYVIFLVICYALHQVCVFAMFVSVMAFFAKISDSSVGGTYMTLLNTLTNLGGNWPAILALYFVDPLTQKQCIGGAEELDNLCRDSEEKQLCTTLGGKCHTFMDGFYIETVICIIIGFAWLQWGKKRIMHLQNLNAIAWKLPKSKK